MKKYKLYLHQEARIRRMINVIRNLTSKYLSNMRMKNNYALPTNLYYKGTRYIKKSIPSFLKRRKRSRFRTSKRIAIARGDLHDKQNDAVLDVEIIPPDELMDLDASDVPCVDDTLENSFQGGDDSSEIPQTSAHHPSSPPRSIALSFDSERMLEPGKPIYLCQSCTKEPAFKQIQKCLHIVCHSCDMTINECKSCRDKDFRSGNSINIWQETDNNGNNIWVGKLSSRGHLKHFYQIENVPSQPYSQCSERTQRKKKTEITRFCTVLNKSEEIEETVLIISDTIASLNRKNTIPIKRGKWTISCETEQFIFNLMDVSIYMRRNLVGELNSRNENFLNPTKMYEALVKKCKLDKMNVEHGFETIEKEVIISGKPGKKMLDLGFAVTKNIEETIQQYLDLTANLITEIPGFKDELWMKVGIDKGADSVKIMISFINRRNKLVNSPHNFLIIASFHGQDKYKDLNKHCPDLFEQLRNLKFLKLGDKMMRLRKFVTGDFMSLSAVRGLKGPQSRLPCPDCYATKSEIQNFDNGIAVRTDKICEHFLSKKVNDTMINLSHENEPLLGFDEFITGLPHLHAFSSPATDIFKRLESMVHVVLKSQLMEEPIPTDILMQDSTKQWDKVKQVTEKERNLRNIAERNFWNYCLEIKNGAPFVPTNFCNKSCVFGGKKGSRNSTIACVDCGHVDHFVCGGATSTTTNYKCLHCTMHTAPDLLIRINTMKEHANRLNEELKCKKAMKEAVGCEKATEYKKLCVKLGIKLKAFHGRMLPGNHVKNFLRKHQLLFDFLIDLSDDEDYRSYVFKLKELVNCLNVMHKLGRATFLKQTDIDNFCKEAENLRVLYKSMNIRKGTPKIHSIIYEMPRFLQKYRTLGLLAEQGVESVHVQFERGGVRYKAIKNAGERLKKTMMRTNERSIVLLLGKKANKNDMPQLDKMDESETENGEEIIESDDEEDYPLVDETERKTCGNKENEENRKICNSILNELVEKLEIKELEKLSRKLVNGDEEELEEELEEALEEELEEGSDEEMDD